MGKRPEDLPINDRPIRVPDPIDPRDTEWYQFMQQIESMIGSGDFTWAEGTLSDIRDTVERTQHVTIGQRNAIDNIEQARTNKGSRRYEGRHRW